MRGIPAAVAIAAALGYSLSGCGSDHVPRANHPPTVEMTSGLVDGDTVSYRVPVSWTGTDPDGVVEYFEYAVDPPAAFSEEEIASGGPGISSQLVRGLDGAPDTTRVTRVGDGGPVTFDWIHAREKGRIFTFTTPTADSTLNPYGIKLPTGRFSGMHALYLRAVDDRGAASVPDKAAFTTQTVCPSSRITRPRIGHDFLSSHPGMIIQWTGEDPDGSTSDKMPVGFLWNIAPYPLFPLPIVPPTPYRLLRTGTWVFQSADTLELAPTFPKVPGNYMIGIRAVDENGAVEPFLDWGRNSFIVGVQSGAGHPLLTVFFDGQTFVPGSTSAQEVEVPADLVLRFTVNCSAADYGETCPDVRWAVDVADLEQESGWTPWGPPVNDVPLAFDTAGIHVLYVQGRDTLGNVSLLTLVMHVVELPFDREVLYVDDFIDKTYPRASQDDAFWQGLFQDYADHSDWDATTFDVIHMYGANDAETFNPGPLDLSDLGRYKLVIWNNLGTGVNGISSLVKTATINPYLGRYLKAGGKLWLSGGATMMAVTISPNGVNGDPEYPKISLGPGQFAYDFLKMHTTKVDNDKGQLANNTLMRCLPFPGKPVIYDSLTVDTGKMNPVTVGLKRGVSFGDVISDPIYAESEAGFRGDLDSLYVYGAAGPFYGSGGSVYQGKLNALRWHDPDPAREHGRVQWFGFPLYYFHDEQARNVFRRSIDWFREESIPMAGGVSRP